VKLDDRHYNARFISEILEYRAREVLEYARDSLDKSGSRDLLPGGVVLPAAGSLLDGMTELAEDIWDARQHRYTRDGSRARLNLYRSLSMQRL
jgi:cell division protein FtsA